MINPNPDVVAQTCEKCGYKWNLTKGTTDSYLCHKCQQGFGKTNNQQKLIESLSKFDYNSFDTCPTWRHIRDQLNLLTDD